jgi:hypothetical protein
MLLGSHERLGAGRWDPVFGVGIAEIDPTSELGSDVRQLHEPERRLLFAILSDAIVRFRQLAAAPRHAQHELREAERWIRSDDRSWPCSFVNICETLDIAWEPLRRAVLKWRHPADDRRRVTRRGLLVKKRRRGRAAASVETAVREACAG